MTGPDRPAPAGPARPDGADPASATPSDLAELEALYRDRYEPSVRLAHLLTGDRARAEELAQDAFVRIAPTLHTVDNPAGYLRTILVNACRDDGRRSQRAKGHPQPEHRTSPPPDVPETATAVWLALQGLPERQRTAVTLRYYLDLPDDEIAELIGARPATVRSLVHRALATLKEVVPHE